GHDSPVCRRIESRAPDLAAVHLASIQMGEHGQFRGAERWLRRTTYCTHDLCPVTPPRLRTARKLSICFRDVRLAFAEMDVMVNKWRKRGWKNTSLRRTKSHAQRFPGLLSQGVRGDR